MAYLLLYNATNCLLWLYILITLITTLTTPSRIYPAVEPYTRWTQTLSIAEILHAASGITRAPVSTTFIQIFTRCVQVWAIDHGYPELFTAHAPPSVHASASAHAPGLGLEPASVYAAMVFAWSLADVVRYAYFVVLLAGLGMPAWLKWLRYSLVFVLYPVGIGGEWWLMYNAANADTTSTPVSRVYYFCLLLYIPGSIVMYSYMVKQRRKTLYSTK